MSKYSFTRRDFLKTAGTLAAGAALGANPEITFADDRDSRFRQIPTRNWQQTFQARLMDKEKGISPHPPARPRLECTSLEVIIDNVNNTRLLNMYVRNTGNWPTYSACIAVYQSKIIMLCPQTGSACDITYNFNDLERICQKVVTIPPDASRPLKINIDNWTPSFLGNFILGICFDHFYDPPAFSISRISLSEVRQKRQLNGLLRQLVDPGYSPGNLYNLIRQPQAS